MANRVLIHSATRMIVHCTKDDANQAESGFEYITVSDGYSIQGPSKKLDVDNSTQLDATAQDITAYKEATNPDIAIVKTLRQKALDLYNAQTTSPELKAFLVALRDWVKEVS